jgi:hypothetical protein
MSVKRLFQPARLAALKGVSARQCTSNPENTARKVRQISAENV